MLAWRQRLSGPLAPLRDAASRLKLWRCARVGASPRVLGKVWIHGEGQVRLGDRVTLDGRVAPIELHAEPGAEIVIGNDVRIEGGASLEAQHSIVVGDHCRIGGFAKVLDNNFHPVSGNRHQRPVSTAVVIEEGAEVGVRAILLPGAHVQKGARIGTGSVISRRIPAGVTVSGVPPKVVK
jgi:acetyltransferase-like isoleucine patch superfamily enzyme